MTLEIHQAVPAHIERLAAIHAESLAEDFLPSLGRDFLMKQYYPAALVSSNGVTLVACEGGQTIGFATVASDSRAFSRDVLRGRMGALAGHALRRALHQPSHLLLSGQVLIAALWPRPNPWPGEIVFIAVDRACRGRGVGHRLIEATQEALRCRGVHRCRTKTLAANVDVIRLYASLGWQVIDRYSLIGRDYVVLLSPEMTAGR